MLHKNTRIIISCEHASFAIPAKEKWFFAPQSVLKSHRGWDVGALAVAKGLSKKWKAPLFKGKHSRLLIDLNRTETHPTAFSEFSRDLSAAERLRIVNTYHGPYRKTLKERVRTELKNSDRVLHLSIHSFTPVFHGYQRTTDLGFLFDPERPLELELCTKWRKEIQKLVLKRTAHLNRPYRGTGDGLITSFRKEFSEEKYVGVEIEINQKYLKNPKQVSSWVSLLGASLLRAKRQSP